MSSTYPSSQLTTLQRSSIPGFAGSDIVQGAPLCIASGGDSSFIMATSSAQKPVGTARDYAVAGDAVAVLDYGNEVRTNIAGMGAGASFSRQSYIGVIGTSTVTHPQSGVLVTAPVLGQVAGTPSVAIGASAAPVWALGVAYESAALGDAALYRVEPALLSGLVIS